MRTSVLLLMLAACGSDKPKAQTPAPAASGSRCGEVADKILASLPEDIKLTPDVLAKVRVMEVSHCENDHWSPEIQTCLLAKPKGSESECASMFTPAQVEGMKQMGADIQALLDAKP